MPCAGPARRQEGPVRDSARSPGERGCCGQGRHLFKFSGGATCLKFRFPKLKQTDIFSQLTNLLADIHLKFQQLFVLRATFNWVFKKPL